MKGRFPSRPKLHWLNEFRHTTSASSDMSLTEMLWVEEPISLSSLDFGFSLCQHWRTKHIWLQVTGSYEVSFHFGELTLCAFCASQSVLSQQFSITYTDLRYRTGSYQSFARYRTAAYLLRPAHLTFFPPASSDAIFLAVSQPQQWQQGVRSLCGTATMTEKGPGSQQKGEINKNLRTNHKEHRRTEGTGTGNM